MRTSRGGGGGGLEEVKGHESGCTACAPGEEGTMHWVFWSGVQPPPRCCPGGPRPSLGAGGCGCGERNRR